ncbi:MATH and LRR domain-containing protein PFE0570w-like [Chironomus tepperi]|uniref:MATH and LRR domain-containing protein PFE0570w-like n=1 Tax=Chironomus tepperi TaxID=113505 RepID=UPI00391FC10C
MSDLTIVELTDSSLKINQPDVILEEKNKRKLCSEDDDDELDDSMAEKKICRDTVNLDDSSLVEPIIEESVIDDSQFIDDDKNVSEGNLIDNKENNEVESINEDPSSLLEDETTAQRHPINEASSEEDDDENYDNSIIMKAVKALPKPLLLPENDEPIALDDSDSECSETIEEINEEQIGDDSLLSLRKRMMRYNPKFYFARGLVKKSIRILLQRKSVRNEKPPIKNYDNGECSVQIISEENNSLHSQTTKLIDNINVEKDDKVGDSQQMEVKDINEEEKMSNGNKASTLDLNVKNINREESLDEKCDPANKHEIGEKKKVINSLENTNAVEIKTLLNEISCSSVDEIISRYIIRNSDNNSIISVDDFSEQLFYCLQENKKEIENIQRIWNEKVHLKFKMREIMERLRRQRVISEIETFGLKSPQDVQQFNILSSKSSTTNSTENDHFDRSSKLSSQSVNRLIQDVRENVLKKEKHKTNDDILPIMNENYEDCASFGINSNIYQSSLNQGRQGQTINVQSIINDFRQKHPQEIPRRGRRMKSSFPNNYFISNQIQAQYNKNDDNKINNSTLDHNSLKSNSSVGFPEVSLLPVNSYYKTHSPQYGQKSSLLQSILTKQPNKNTSTTQSNKSSTLARLLTAPEKSFQSSSRNVLQQNSKVHNNGEITITPIAGSSRRHMIDDEENSEPPLIIDESEDFDISDRHNASASDLLCQGCRRNKALFMCAGCSRQWYCSKECQELAWDDHAESCMV